MQGEDGYKQCLSEHLSWHLGPYDPLGHTAIPKGIETTKSNVKIKIWICHTIYEKIYNCPWTNSGSTNTA